MFKNNELVWAKLKGYTHWPAKIVNSPPPRVLAIRKSMKSFCVYFFGSHDYAWISPDCIESYDSFNSSIHENVGHAIKRPYLKAQFLKALKELKSADAKAKGVTLRKKGVKKVVESADDSSQNEPKSDSMDVDPNEKIEECHDQATEMRISVHQKQENVKTMPLRDSMSSLEVTDDDESDDESSEMEVLDESSEIEPVDEDLEFAEEKFEFGFISPDAFGLKCIEKLIDKGISVCAFAPTQEDIITDLKLFSSPLGVLINSEICVSYAPDPKKTMAAWSAYYRENPNSIKRIPTGIISMSHKDAETSVVNHKAFNDFGISYLEAKIHGSYTKEEKKFLLTSAGDETLYDLIKESLDDIYVMRFLGNVVNHSKINLVLNVFSASTVANMANSLSFANKAEVPMDMLSTILASTSLRSDLVMDTLDSMTKNDFSNVNLPIKDVQKDLATAMDIAANDQKVLLLSCAANEMYKKARNQGLANSDISAVKKVVEDF